MNTTTVPRPTIGDELELLQQWVTLDEADIVELGCGAAQLARGLLAAHPGCRVTGLEVDRRQLAKNLQQPQAGLHFVEGGAEAIPFADASFDLALMLKSLHHVPLPLMDQALVEAWRVLRPGGHLYVSEPVFAGDFNDIVRLFHDEGAVRAAAQAALDRALAGGGWERAQELHFDVPARFADFAEFERRMVHVTFAERRLDDVLRATVRERFQAHVGADGARFLRPMHVRLLRKRAP
jgi:SAM-dependent methyltransferase